MKDLAIKAVVTSAEGFFYREEHEWRNIPPEAAQLFLARLREVETLTKKASSSGGDDGLTTTFSATIDGGVQADLVVGGISYVELSKFQRQWQKWGDEVVGLGESRARDKDKKRGWDGRGGKRDDD